MDCRETCAKLEDFFHSRLPFDELESFVEHIHSCGACEEELKTYVVIDVGLEQLEDDTDGVYDPEGAYAACMDSALNHIDEHLVWKSFRYAMSTIAFWFVVLAFLLKWKIGF